VLHLLDELLLRRVRDVRVRLHRQDGLEAARLPEVLLVGEDEQDARVDVAEPLRERRAARVREVGAEDDGGRPVRRVELERLLRVLGEEDVESRRGEALGHELARGAVTLGEQDAAHGAHSTSKPEEHDRRTVRPRC
jgi:hypothetical protein